MTAHAKKTVTGFQLQHDNLAVGVYACCDETQYCIDVALKQGKTCLDNDHDCSGLPLQASPEEIDRYLQAALASVVAAFTTAGDIACTADRAARAGCAALDQETKP